MKVINLFGGPGSGKSTTAAGLFYKTKLGHESVELVSEYAKKLYYSNRLDDMLDQQEYIFAKQNQLLHSLRNHVNWAITDSPLLLSMVYASDDWPCVRQFKELVLASFNTYDNINIVLERPSVPFQQYGRRHNLEESISIDNQVIQLLNDLDIKYHTFIHSDTEIVNDIYANLSNLTRGDKSNEKRK